MEILMANRPPSYNKLFTIQNHKIGAAIIADDAEKARKEIDILERLVKLKKSFMEIAEKRRMRPKKRTALEARIEKDKLLNELEQRFIRISEADQQMADLK